MTKVPFPTSEQWKIARLFWNESDIDHANTTFAPTTAKHSKKAKENNCSKIVLVNSRQGSHRKMKLSANCRFEHI
jgi:hypothetical protein